MVFKSFLLAVFSMALFVSNAKGRQGDTCEVKVEQVGCFKDYSRPLNKLLVYRRTTYNHEEQNVDLPQLLCDCAKKAHSRGYGYIGLQYYAECWSSRKTEPGYNRDGPSTNNCYNADYQQCSQDDTECVGGERTNYVYKIVYSDSATPEMNELPSTTKVISLASTQLTYTTAEVLRQPTEGSTILPESTSNIVESTSKPSQPSPITAKPSIGRASSEMSGGTPSVVSTQASTKTPCSDKGDDCVRFQRYCTKKYPTMLAECPKTCNRCA